KELIFNPLKFGDEIIVRNKILNNPFDLSALIVIDKIIDEKYEIFINSIIYEDIKEEII
ncbi:diacylglucosamine hydrolase like protein, partial [Aliarcobacter skirrowii]|nr:diacylglucosamine hydrolase like protein [Aliarcobacter skirrowii]